MEIKSNHSLINIPRISNFLSLPFNPNLTRTFAEVDSFSDLDVSFLTSRGIKALILDLDGTLVEHGRDNLSSQTISKIQEIQARAIRMCILSNNVSSRSYSITSSVNMDLLQATPLKPHPESFLCAMKKIGIDDPSQCAMVGDNFNTDAGANSVGMHFIYVKPIPGTEPIWVKLTRSYAAWWAKLHHFSRKLTN